MSSEIAEKCADGGLAGEDAAALSGRAGRGLRSTVLVQLFGRALSFALKTVVTRTLGPQRFVHTEMRVTLAWLVHVREPFRRAAIRAATQQQAIKLARLGLLMSMVFLLLVNVARAVLRRDVGATVLVLQLSAALETFADVDVVLASRKLALARVAASRTAAQLCTVALSALLLSVVPSDALVFTSAAATCAYGLVLLISLWPGRSDDASPSSAKDVATADDSAEAYALVTQSMSQSLVKSLLAGNGEDLILMAVLEAPELGAYKLATNVSSLLARLFFEPLEDACFVSFSQLRTAEASAASERDAAVIAQRRRRTLYGAVRASVAAAMAACALGSAFSSAGVRALYGASWAKSAAPSALRAQLVYLCFLAVNGVNEACFNATASAAQLRAYTAFLARVCLVYLGVAGLCAYFLGSIGVVLANCANMLVRATYCAHFIAERDALPRLAAALPLNRGGRHLQSLALLRAMAPSPSFCAACVLACAITHVSEYVWADLLTSNFSVIALLLHGVSGAVATVFLIAVAYRYDRELIRGAFLRPDANEGVSSPSAASTMAVRSVQSSDSRTSARLSSQELQQQTCSESEKKRR